MSRKRVSDLRGNVRAADLDKGPNGRALCRFCGEEVPVGRFTFCNDACVHEHRLRTQPSYVRRCVKKRDKGMCANCGVDTVALRNKCLKILKDRSKDAVERRKLINEALEYEGFPNISKKRLSKKRLQQGWFWQADHIKAVRDGGGLCGLDNYQTLCRVCHLAKSVGERRLRKAME